MPVLLCVCRARSGRAAAAEWGSAIPSLRSFSSSTTSCRTRRASWPAPNNWVGSDDECLCRCFILLAPGGSLNAAFGSINVDILNIYCVISVSRWPPLSLKLSCRRSQSPIQRHWWTRFPSSTWSLRLRACSRNSGVRRLCFSSTDTVWVHTGALRVRSAF